MAAEPFRSLETYARRYPKLREVFDKFHANVKTLPTFGTPPLLSTMTVTDVTEPGFFDLSIAGTTTRVQFEYLPGSEHGDSGLLRTFVLDPFTQRLGGLLETVPFTSTSETNFKFDSGDPIVLNDQAGAFQVIGLLVKNAIERKP